MKTAIEALEIALRCNGKPPKRLRNRNLVNRAAYNALRVRMERATTLLERAVKKPCEKDLTA